MKRRRRVILAPPSDSERTAGSRSAQTPRVHGLGSHPLPTELAAPKSEVNQVLSRAALHALVEFEFPDHIRLIANEHASSITPVARVLGQWLNEYTIVSARAKNSEGKDEWWASYQWMYGISVDLR